ncbi:hypothetical protein O0L34_g19163 [Tuta absoluta]|nr:hypothetical protein O0L34_g19163 [Tuta absoluta]
MRLHALILALAVLGAHAASIPDKKDIEKKLAQVVQEVLDKDGVPIPADNAASAQEIIEGNAEIKDIENNLRKQPVDIPVKVVVEDVKPVLKSEDKKEDNVVSPANESDEIVREEIDLKNPGPPQRTQHDTQNPETFMDSLKNVVFKNSEWKASEQYAQLQKEITTLKESFENKMNELYGNIQEHLNLKPTPAVAVDEKQEDAIKVRAVVRQDAGTSPNGESSSTGSGTTGGSTSGSTGSTDSSSGSWGSGPFGGFFQNWATSFQQNLQNLNQTVNNYWVNQTANSNSSNACGSNSAGGVFGGWGQSNPLAGFGQQSQQPATGQAQSDEPARPSAGGIWQTIQQNVQNFIGGGNQPPAGAQADAQQPPQPNRPVIQAFQNVIQQAGSLFNRPGSEPQSSVPASSAPAQEGSNVVPAQPDAQKQPEPQPSGPIKQMIASNPVAQGIVGAFQNIQNTILPTRSREEVKSVPEVSAEASKGGFRPVRPNQPSPGML